MRLTCRRDQEEPLLSSRLQLEAWVRIPLLTPCWLLVYFSSVKHRMPAWQYTRTETQHRIVRTKMQGQNQSCATSINISTRIIENVETKCIIFGSAYRIRVKNFKQNLPENYSKSTKIAITASNFSKIFRRSMPPDPLRAHRVSQSASSLFCPQKMWKSCLPPFFFNFSLRHCVYV